MINIPRIQVFRPSMEEMKDFEGYINKIEKSGAHKAGLAKVSDCDILFTYSNVYLL